MNRTCILITLILLNCSSFACDPLSLDWENFHQKYDTNKNNRFELKEFQQVKNFSPLPWPDDKRFQGKDKNSTLFHFLDQNHDGKLTDEELGGVHSLLPNPCADWPSR